MSLKLNAGLDFVLEKKLNWVVYILEEKREGGLISVIEKNLSWIGEAASWNDFRSDEKSGC